MTELKSDALETVNFSEAGTGQTMRGNSTKMRDPLRLSETRLAFYLLVSGIIGFTILRLLTDQEAVIALGTLDLAIIGMWIWAFWSKARLLSAALKHR
ncbi:MAG: hypothetical protein ACREEM_26540 [Blastocatellia bacterium]